MTVELFCKECRKSRKHEVNQENGKITCHYCGMVMSGTRHVKVQHNMNKPIPKNIIRSPKSFVVDCNVSCTNTIKTT